MGDSLIVSKGYEAVDAGLVVIESSWDKPEQENTSSSSGNYTTQLWFAISGTVHDDEQLRARPQPGNMGLPPVSGHATTLPHAFNTETLQDINGAWNMDTSLGIFIPHVFLVNQHTWHQRVGHPGGEVLRRLVSSNFISYNKEKPPVLCHACQLGKHVRLLFVSSSIVISSCFDIIHSDVWTSPILSLSVDSFKTQKTSLEHFTASQNSLSIYIQLFSETLTHEAKTGKSISLTEAEEEAVAREVHATHARIVSGPDLEPARRTRTIKLWKIPLYDQEKSKVIEESDSTIPDPSHQTVTSTPPVIAPFTDVSSTKPVVTGLSSTNQHRSYNNHHNLFLSSMKLKPSSPQLRMDGRSLTQE
ncbi:ribonuclease H-like domain-containing protein [Tanacetum coccineum]